MHLKMDNFYAMCILPQISCVFFLREKELFDFELEISGVWYCCVLFIITIIFRVFSHVHIIF